MGNYTENIPPLKSKVKAFGYMKWSFLFHG